MLTGLFLMPVVFKVVSGKRQSGIDCCFGPFVGKPAEGWAQARVSVQCRSTEEAEKVATTCHALQEQLEQAVLLFSREKSSIT